MSATATVIYGPEADEPEEYPYSLVLIDRKIWEAGGDWTESYDSEEFEAIYDEICERFELDPIMENCLNAQDKNHYREVLDALAADPRFRWVDDVYASPEAY